MFTIHFVKIFLQKFLIIAYLIIHFIKNLIYLINILCIMSFNPLKINDCKIEVGQWVKVLRKQAKISQQELANTLNISRINIQNVE